jgi:hypothetical protein
MKFMLLPAALLSPLLIIAIMSLYASFSEDYGIPTPKTPTKRLHSRQWATIGYAHKLSIRHGLADALC